MQRPVRDGQVLCSRLPDPRDTSKLLVAPCFLPNSFAGDYWILAVGKNYEWAVVSGGKPTVQYSDGCTTKEEGINGSGLWVFTRKQTDEASVKEALNVLKAKGYTTQRLVRVAQEGCKYEGARIK